MKSSLFVAPVMVSGGVYNENSSFQEKALQPSLTLAKAEIGNAIRLAKGRPVHIADLGASQGRNSTLVFKQLIAAAASANADSGQPLQMVVTHEDLPANDFRALLRLLDDPATTYNPAKCADEEYRNQCQGVEVFPNIVGCSFHQRLFPDASIHLALAFACVMFVSHLPIKATDSVVACDSDDPSVREAFDEQGRKDLALFLRLRAAEMPPGASIIFHLPCMLNEKDMSSPASITYFSRQLRDMRNAGELSSDEVGNMTMPVSIRPHEHIKQGILNDAGEQWEIVHEQLLPCAPPQWDALQSGDITPQQYGQAISNTWYAVMGEILTGGLARTRGEQAARELVDKLFAKAAAAAADQPERFEFPFSYFHLVRKA